MESDLVTIREIRQKERMTYLERERGLECCRFRLETYNREQYISVTKSEYPCRITMVIFIPKEDLNTGLATIGENNLALVVIKQSKPNKMNVK